ncbi:MAG: 2,3-diphosphoglycerate-dependent phosphoglycerate mutase [Candidatus Parcubacteria bacterium]|jgi:2,3-bisphosphoglycerate-dependent phosphoglycerate mutase
MSRIILVRHGESKWDQESRYIGWNDVPLLSNREDLRHIGNILLNQRADIDLIITSVLERSIVSAWTIMNNMYHSWITEIHDWRLNPRHYGVVQGLTYQETLLKYPNIDDITLSWDKMVDPVGLDNKQHPRHDRRYAHVSPDKLPAVESFKDVYTRVEEFILDTLMPALSKNHNILIVAHQDSIASILKYFKNLSVEEVVKIDIVLSQAIVLDYEYNTGKVVQSILE